MFGLLINERHSFDDFVLVDDYPLAEMAPTALIVELMHNFARIVKAVGRKDLIDDVS